MLALLALDALGKSKAFPRDDVSEEMLSNISITRQPFYYKELIGPLKQCGREDLELILGKKMRTTVTPLGILQSRIKKLDKRYLNGGLGKLASLVSKGKRR